MYSLLSQRSMNRHSLITKIFIVVICVSSIMIFSSYFTVSIQNKKYGDQHKYFSEEIQVKELKTFCEPKNNSVCFIGKRFCHPGYTGNMCDQKLIPANPWYTADCPNLKQDITFDIKMPLEMFYTKKLKPPNKNTAFY